MCTSVGVVCAAGAFSVTVTGTLVEPLAGSTTGTGFVIWSVGTVEAVLPLLTIVHGATAVPSLAPCGLESCTSKIRDPAGAIACVGIFRSNSRTEPCRAGS